MPVPIPAESLLGRLQTLDDPRASNRQYPLAPILGALILGLLNGQTSASGAWDWPASSGACSGSRSAFTLRTVQRIRPFGICSRSWMPPPLIRSLPPG